MENITCLNAAFLIGGTNILIFLCFCSFFQTRSIHSGAHQVFSAFSPPTDLWKSDSAVTCCQSLREFVHRRHKCTPCWRYWPQHKQICQCFFPWFRCISYQLWSLHPTWNSKHWNYHKLWQGSDTESTEHIAIPWPQRGRDYLTVPRCTQNFVSQNPQYRLPQIEIVAIPASIRIVLRELSPKSLPHVHWGIWWT